ncbi:cytochrome c [Deinococcus sp. KSM4-11]|uniref:c-type cytochrome n=1 Tax=Deinococcus sp. KSM4-11 TaxID=2568654 RepID=UPI0010A3DB8B|nr:cytochrome c [Deinococcus sp. KSM4-11]THF85577.1 cytochrome c [Deinococcus sp. KSM4-11]
MKYLLPTFIASLALTAAPHALSAAPTAPAAAPNGKSLYTANCAACHQATGKGVPGAFPPLAGHFSEILAADGRKYTINVVLNGLNGAIKVNGKTYNGVMPGFAQLSDAEIAAVLNEVSTSWKNALPDKQKPYTADEVKAERAAKKTTEQVHDLRPATLK